eukprot:5453348-Prymnesium_polylepis.1
MPHAGRNASNAPMPRATERGRGAARRAAHVVAAVLVPTEEHGPRDGLRPRLTGEHLRGDTWVQAGGHRGGWWWRRGWGTFCEDGRRQRGGGAAALIDAHARAAASLHLEEGEPSAREGAVVLVAIAELAGRLHVHDAAVHVHVAAAHPRVVVVARDERSVIVAELR